MADKEKESGIVVSIESVVVETTADSRHKHPFRPTELQGEATADLHQKRSRVPAVPSLAEELKGLTIRNDIMDRKQCDKTMPPEKHSKTEMRSSNTKRRDQSPETINLAPLEVGTKKEDLCVPGQPIPAQVEAVASATSKPNLISKKIWEKDIDKKADDENITEEVAELRTAEEAERSEWSDDDGAGGLSRCDSRSSRVSRVVRQLFCCGVMYEAPSEENVYASQGYNTGI